jgi:hypothetical protein
MVNILQNTYDSGARAVRFPGLKCNMLHGFERESRNIMQHFGFFALPCRGRVYWLPQPGSRKGTALRFVPVGEQWLCPADNARANASKLRTSNHLRL